MRGEAEVLSALQGLLTDEIAAVNQYIVHAEVCENWGYGKLAAYIKGRAITEMKHAEGLIARIVFLEGQPEVSTVGPIEIGNRVPAMLQSDLDAELRAVLRYNDAIATAAKLGDSATRDLLERILVEEDGHVDVLEGLLEQIKQMGEQNFLSTQVG